MAKYLIINADDFGYAHGVNRGIVVAYLRGVVSSTSLMVDARAAEEVRSVAQEHPKLGVGLHFVAVQHGVPLFDLNDVVKVEQELNRQYQRCCELIGRFPTHLDSHEHIHFRYTHLEPVFRMWAAEQHLPLRKSGQVRFEGGFYGERYDDKWGAFPAPELISIEAFERILRSLPEGVTELACHPGYVTPDLDSSYVAERELELATLLNPRVPALFREFGVSLINFATLPKGNQGL